MEMERWKEQEQLRQDGERFAEEILGVHQQKLRIYNPNPP